MEKKFLAAGMMVTSIFIFAFSSSHSNQIIDTNTTISNKPLPVISQNAASLPVLTDTVPGKKKARREPLNGIINSSVNGKQYKIVTKNGQLVELYVDNEKVPPGKIAAYKTVTGKILKEAKLDMERSEKDLEEAQQQMEIAQADLEESQKEMLEAKLEIEKAQQEMETDIEQSQQDTEEYKIEIENQQREIEHAMMDIKKAKENMVQDKKLAKLQMEQAKKDMAQSKLDMEQYKKDVVRYKEDAAVSKKLQEKIIDDFVSENIISDKKELASYKLSDEELIVNGIKQPEATHKKFKDKYVKGKKWTMQYNFNREIK